MKSPRHHISRIAFLLAALLIAVTSVSLVFVGFVASQTSRQQALQNEERLFESALKEHLRTLARDQISVAVSDRSVENFVRQFNPGFVRERFDDLWTNHAHDKNMLIAGDGIIRAESFSDYTHIVERPVSETPGLSIVAARVNALYLANRVRVPGGFGIKSVQGQMPDQYAVTGFLRLDGKPTLFSAMPISPDAYKTTLPDGEPAILLSAHYIDTVFLKQLNAQLDFSSITFSSAEDPAHPGPMLKVSGPNGDTIGQFLWSSPSQSSSIWPTVIPVIALLSICLAALAFGIAWKIGKLTASLQESEEQNRYLALHDSMSGLANRLQFNRALANAAKSLPNRPFALLHCDLDKFKFVNDTYGHGAGDLVIKTVASRLKDLVGDQGLVCRVGGDEFMVIYRQSAARSRLRLLCGSMLEKAREPIMLSETVSVEIGLSIGISIAPEHGTSPDLLVARSDTALYQSKQQGRDRFSFFSDSGHEPGNPTQQDQISQAAAS